MVTDVREFPEVMGELINDMRPMAGRTLIESNTRESYHIQTDGAEE